MATSWRGGDDLPRPGHGALVVREQNKVAVMLAPPLEFAYRSKRVGEGEAPPEELYINGHFIMLVPRSGKVTPRWAFDEERAEYSNVNKHTYKIAVAQACKALGPGAISKKVVEFLAALE